MLRSNSNQIQEPDREPDIELCECKYWIPERIRTVNGGGKYKTHGFNLEVLLRATERRVRAFGNMKEYSENIREDKEFLKKYYDYEVENTLLGDTE